MNITQRQIANPGIYEYDDRKRKAFMRYKESVGNANFLNESEKRNWKLLGYLLSAEQLKQAEKLIISEGLRMLKMKKQLEIIKTKEK